MTLLQGNVLIKGSSVMALPLQPCTFILKNYPYNSPELSETAYAGL